MYVYTLEQLECVPAHLLLIYEQALGGVSTQPDVVTDGALGNLVQFLVNHGNTMFQGMLGIGEIEGFAFKEKLAGILPVDAEKAFHEGGFTRTVLAHQGMDRTGFYLKVHILEYLDT
jgi:hypothetical protein